MSTLKINENIARLRREKGITQEELAVALGVSNQAVSKWEAGKCCPDIEMLPELAGYFRVSIDELMGYKPYATPASHAPDDTLLLQAIEIAKELKRISTSTLQRKLCIGYARAESLLRSMADGGYIVRDKTKRYNAYLYVHVQG